MRPPTIERVHVSILGTALGGIVPWLLLPLCTTLWAQERPILQPGAQIRLTATTPAGPQAFSGALQLFTPDTIAIVPRGAVRSLSFALLDLKSLAVNLGKPRGLQYGAPIFGGVLGAWFGATALAPDATCRAQAVDDADCHWETPATVVGAGAGVVVFSLVVTVLVPARWQQMPLAGLQVTYGQERGRSFHIGLAHHF